MKQARCKVLLLLVFLLSIEAITATDLQYISEKTWQHASSPTYSRGLWVGDLDRDGFIEIASAGYRDNPSTEDYEACLRIYRYIASSHTWMGEGARKWASPTGDMKIQDVTVGDLEKDGEMEIVTVGYFWNGSTYKYQIKAWFKARGNRAPVVEKTLNNILGTRTQLFAVAFGDVDEDGQNEIVTVGSCKYSGHPYFAGYIGIFHYSETDGFTLEGQFYYDNLYAHLEFMDVEVGDVDGDGDTEIVVSGYSDVRCILYVFRWSGSSIDTESYASFQVSSYDTFGDCVAIGDVDDDGDTEIVVGGSLTDEGFFLRVYRHTGTSLIAEHTHSLSHGVTAYVGGIDIGDVDDDGDTEIAIGYNYQPGIVVEGRVNVYRWDGATWSGEDAYLFTIDGWDTYVKGLSIYDVDQDGEQEIVVTGYAVLSSTKAYIMILDA